MAVNKEAYKQLTADLGSHHVTLVAVSKTKSLEEIKALYDLGHRDFGENYVQELVEKQGQLPTDIRWHFIGHLQTNKVKYIVPFIYLIQSVDSLKLLKEINKEAKKHKRVVDVLLQLHITDEETKFGMDGNEIASVLDMLNTDQGFFNGIKIKGMMGMASFTNDLEKIGHEFNFLIHMATQTFDALPQKHKEAFTILSCGMSNDYKLAIEKGSNMVRIGSLIFGERT